MLDLHYTDPRLVEIYDLDSGWSVDRDFYLSLAGDTQKTILDLGCGTGLLCNAYAEKGHKVTGVDPSSVMLDAGRSKSCGHDIEWIQSPAQNFQSDAFFDLIVMTGHAFQVLLEDNDILATFQRMHTYLKSEGRIVFESRNPEIDWASQWDYDIALELSGYTVQESRRFLNMKNGHMNFELCYQFPDKTLVSKSVLRFASHQEIEHHLATARLGIDKLLGDWGGQPFHENSHEMIFVVRKQ